MVYCFSLSHRFLLIAAPLALVSTKFTVYFTFVCDGNYLVIKKKEACQHYLLLKIKCGEMLVSLVCVCCKLFMHYTISTISPAHLHHIINVHCENWSEQFRDNYPFFKHNKHYSTIKNKTIVPEHDDMFSHYSSEEYGFGIFVPQTGPLHKEIIWDWVQNLPRERQSLHTANTFNVNNQDFLHSQNSEQESCHTQRNAGPRAITQHLK